MPGHEMRRFQAGRSPFDEIVHREDNGTEWWSAREMMPLLGYVKWDNMLATIDRAKASARNTGIDPASIFLDVSKYSEVGRRPGLDVQMLRRGCYLLAMNGDPTKPEIAAAQSYFAIMTRIAEKMAEAPAIFSQASKPWSERFRDTTSAHFCYLNINHPGYFSVVSATVIYVLIMEEELIRHLLPLKPGDLPDGSIGSHWAKHRWIRGLAPSTLRAPLLMPSRGIDAQVLIYPIQEHGDFMAWFNGHYIPEHLPNYYGNKPEFRSQGALAPASAADNTSLRLVGQHAQLKPAIREKLTAIGGFAPAAQPKRSALN